GRSDQARPSGHWLGAPIWVGGAWVTPSKTKPAGRTRRVDEIKPESVAGLRAKSAELYLAIAHASWVAGSVLPLAFAGAEKLNWLSTCLPSVRAILTAHEKTLEAEPARVRANT